MINLKSNEIRKKKISASLKAYFMTEQGFVHKNKLSTTQAKRMALYNDYIKNNRTKIKTDENK